MTSRYNNSGSLNFALIGILFLFSGATGLILQVVWMYRLGLVFGNAAYATAATLASFFLGLALGGKIWGKRAEKIQKPLLTYGLIEIAVAATALLFIPGLEIYRSFYPNLIVVVGEHTSLVTLAKFIFSSALLFLPTIFMGGTFPILAQFIGQYKLASRGTLLYTLNTLGATIGTFFAGFYLLVNFGVSTTYSIAVIIATCIGLVAILLSYRLPSSEIDSKPPQPEPSDQKSFQLSNTQFSILAFSSGMLAIAAETAWSKMFSQVFQNSVYSFSAILVVFLLALCLGGFLAHYLVKRAFPPQKVMLVLLTMGAILVGCSPRVFDYFTNGLTYVAVNKSWEDYLKSIFILSSIVVGAPTIVFGALFPYLLKMYSSFKVVPGNYVGKMVFMNSMGSACGPIIVGFILLNMVGIWISIKLIAIGYGLLGLFVVLISSQKNTFKRSIVPITVIAFIILLGAPPIVKLNSNERLLASWQSADGIVTVVKTGGNVDMRLNNTYVLGDSQSVLVEQMQAHIPLLLHPEPKKVLFLGMGTGVTAGAALNHQVERVDVVEIVSDVITAAKTYFTAWTNHLFRDERVKIISDDARNYLLGSSQEYDLIIGDLFSPWHSGTGSLYTIEHFQQVENHLDSGGIFAQWLPLYQLTNESFGSIVATFNSVFPVVTLWRADFSSDKPSIVLIGQQDGTRLNNSVLQHNIKNIVDQEKKAKAHMAGLFYLGNSLAIKDEIQPIRINNDDKRTIEFLSPVASQQANAGRKSYLIKEEQTKLFEKLSSIAASKDPYLSNLPLEELKYVEVGRLYFEYLRLIDSDLDKAESKLKEIQILDKDFIKTN